MSITCFPYDASSTNQIRRGTGGLSQSPIRTNPQVQQQEFREARMEGDDVKVDRTLGRSRERGQGGDPMRHKMASGEKLVMRITR